MAQKYSTLEPKIPILNKSSSKKKAKVRTTRWKIKNISRKAENRQSVVQAKSDGQQGQHQASDSRTEWAEKALV